MHNVVFIRAKEPGKLRLNEGVFGSYKNKRVRSREDKMKEIEDMTTKIMDDAATELKDSFKEQVYCALYGQDLLNVADDYPLYELCAMDNKVEGDFAYDEIVSKIADPGKTLALPFLTEFKVSNKILNIDVKIPLRLVDNYFNLPEFFDENMLNALRSVINDIPISNKELNEKLKDWYDANDIKFNIKYHLMGKDPEKFFNKEIIEKQLNVFDTGRNVANIQEAMKDIHSMFEWFPVIYCENLYTDECYAKKYFGSFKNMIDVVSSFCKVGRLDITVMTNNDLYSLGDINKIFMDKSIYNKFFGHGKYYSPYSPHSKIEIKYGNVQLTLNVKDERRRLEKNQDDALHNINYVFTDKLLKELTGYDNKTIISKCKYSEQYSAKGFLDGEVENIPKKDQDKYICVALFFNAFNNKYVYVGDPKVEYSINSRPSSFISNFGEVI